MSGNFSIPKETSATTASWVSEGSAGTESYPVIGQVQFTPKTITAYTDISRRFIKNSVIPAEDFVRMDIAKVLAIGLETAAFEGTGSSNQPLGIVTNLTNNLSANIISLGTNGAAETFQTVIGLETQVANANADTGKLAYVANSKVRGALKNTAKSTSAVAAGFVWDDGEVNGYPAAVTNVLPNNGTKGSGTNLSTMVFGDYSSLYYVLWGGLDILVDPFTGSNTGTVRINAYQDVDINVRHLESFAAHVDIIA
jgi:HK97 family phage major capsid protein